MSSCIVPQSIVSQSSYYHMNYISYIEQSKYRYFRKTTTFKMDRYLNPWLSDCYPKFELNALPIALLRHFTAVIKFGCFVDLYMKLQKARFCLNELIEFEELFVQQRVSNSYTYIHYPNNMTIPLSRYLYLNFLLIKVLPSAKK